MDKATKEVIRNAVRERYGQIANANTQSEGVNIM